MNGKRLAVALFVALLACSSLAHAQATRTWVSGVGDDANPCSRTAPCKTFAGAISKTAAGGEINVLDPGGFGAVTITKSITISSEKFEAGVLVSGTNGIVISAAATDVVVLRGLDIEGLGTGLDGIKVLGGLAALQIENCTINKFRGSNGSGIDIAPTTAGTLQLSIKDTVIRNNGQGTGGGILIRPASGVTVKGSLDNVRVENNVFGIKVQDFSTVAVHNSVFAGSQFSGVTAITSAGGSAAIVMDHSMSVNNGSTGLQVNGTNTVLRISSVTSSGNAIGIQAQNSGQVLSWGDNNNDGNTTNVSTSAGGVVNMIAKQ